MQLHRPRHDERPVEHVVEAAQVLSEHCQQLGVLDQHLARALDAELPGAEQMVLCLICLLDGEEEAGEAESDGAAVGVEVGGKGVEGASAALDAEEVVGVCALEQRRGVAGVALQRALEALEAEDQQLAAGAVVVHRHHAGRRLHLLHRLQLQQHAARVLQQRQVLHAHRHLRNVDCVERPRALERLRLLAEPHQRSRRALEAAHLVHTPEEHAPAHVCVSCDRKEGGGEERAGLELLVGERVAELVEHGAGHLLAPDGFALLRFAKVEIEEAHDLAFVAHLRGQVLALSHVRLRTGAHVAQHLAQLALEHARNHLHQQQLVPAELGVVLLLHHKAADYAEVAEVDALTVDGEDEVLGRAEEQVRGTTVQ
mmetsp:Transcript_18129/g.70083  ORF Transcript_18129/g.70083 Transcript_18129/m.70083 type:complete len:370 (+) Transcript_18129:181-1290(+)